MAHGWTRNEEKLLEAARKCDGKTISDIVKSGKVNVNVTDKAGCTAVHLCCKSADLESLAVLLEHGPRTEVFDNGGMAPFHHAAVKDYVETMALLVSYGADVDVKNKRTDMTPLHYASINKRSRATKFLLFCGADPDIKDKEGRVAVTGIAQTQSDTQKIIRDAFKAKQIEICGKMIKRNEKHSFRHGLKIDNCDKDSKAFSFLCRKMLINYMGIEDTTTRRHLEKVITGDSGEIISDLYDYLVNQTVSCVTVSIPAYTKASAFDAVVLRDSTGEEFKCSECVENEMGTHYTFNMALKANEDTVNTFAVVAVPKRDVTMTTGTEQTIQSTVDPRFGVLLPERCLPRNTTVELQMVAVNDYVSGLNTDYITGVSNFCSVRINHKNRRALTVTLPLPDAAIGHGQKTNHTVFYADEGTQTPEEWKEINSFLRDSEKCMEVTDPAVANGTCVVLEVQKERKKDFLDHVVGFLKWLYRSATCRLRPCCFYGMTRFCSLDTYKILIGVTDAKLVDDVLNRWRKENFVTLLSQKTAVHLLKSNSHFAVRASQGVRVKGAKCQTLVYQRSREFHQEFLICGQDHDVVQFLIHQVSNQTSLTSVGGAKEQSSSKYVTQINVELLRENNTGQDSNSALQFTEYPDNRFLSWLAGELGHEWMMVGIGLGQKYSYLETIEKGNSLKRTIQTMLYTWRTDANRDPDVGLTLLIHSLTRVGRKDLVSEINQQVQKLLKDKPEERLSRWVTGLTSGLDDVDAGPVQNPDGKSTEDEICISCLIEQEKILSPFSEEFLLTAVSITGSNLHLLAQLNLPQSTVDGVRQTVPDPVSAMFKCLLIARRKYGDVVSFFEDLFAALETDHNQDAICRLKREIQIWYNMGKNSLDGEARRLAKMLDKY